MKQLKNNRLLQKRIFFLIFILLLFSLAVIFASYTLRDKISYFYTPSELLTKNIDITKKIRVGGLIQEKTLKFKNGVWSFIVIDENNGTIPVIYKGTLPNLVQENKGIIAEGKYINSQINASLLLAKHDENYMPDTAVQKLKDEGLWRE